MSVSNDAGSKRVLNVHVCVCVHHSLWQLAARWTKHEPLRAQCCSRKIKVKVFCREIQTYESKRNGQHDQFRWTQDEKNLLKRNSELTRFAKKIGKAVIHIDARSLNSRVRFLVCVSVCDAKYNLESHFFISRCQSRYFLLDASLLLLGWESGNIVRNVATRRQL